MATPSERLVQLLGADEARRYLALHAAHAAARRRGGDRLFGGIELHPPGQIEFLEGDFRPGLLAMGRELAGDHLCWDLRRGRPAGSTAGIVYCDHEIGEARPFARDVGGAFIHLLLQALIGIPGHEAVAELERWMDHYRALLGPRELERLRRLQARARRGGKAPLFATEKALRPAVRDLVPRAAAGFDWAMLPPTDVPLLDPENRTELGEAIALYQDSVATYRIMVVEEGREGYAPYLAAALRSLSEVCLRRGRLEAALQAAREALSLHARAEAVGDPRFTIPLLFLHRVMAVILSRRGRPAEALGHAERALQLGETLHLEAAALIRAQDHLGDALERERAGDDRYEVQLRLKLALKGSQDFLRAEPPHPFQPYAERIARLAKRRSGRR